jgi:hypothetical protein
MIACCPSLQEIWLTESLGSGKWATTVTESSVRLGLLFCGSAGCDRDEE